MVEILTGGSLIDGTGDGRGSARRGQAGGGSRQGTPRDPKLPRGALRRCQHGGDTEDGVFARMTVNCVWKLPTLSRDPLKVETRAPMRPAIGIGIRNPGGWEIQADDVTAAIRAAFDGGDGVTVCRLYMEMSLVCLEAAGRGLRELGRG